MAACLAGDSELSGVSHAPRSRRGWPGRTRSLIDRPASVGRDVFRDLPRGFRRLWAASAISNVGDGVRAVALPLLATELTDDPRLIAGVVVAERIPWLVFILPGGVWADRYDRRRLRVRLDIVRGVVVGLLALLVTFDVAAIGWVFATAALLAAAESVVDSSSMALVPSLVRRDQLERAGGVMSSTELIGQALIGPPLGGLLFATALAMPFGFDAVTFIAAAVVASTIRGNFTATPASESGETDPPRSLKTDLAVAVRWLKAHTLLRNLALVSMLLGFLNLMHGAVFVIYARAELGLGPVGFGLLLIAPAIGGIFGSIAAGALSRFHLTPVLTTSVIIGGAAIATLAATDQPAVAAALLFIDAFTVLVWNVLTVALRQRLIPDHLLGRVSAAYRFVVYLAMPIGAFIGGLIADQATIFTVFTVAGLGQIAAALIVATALRPTYAADDNDGPYTTHSATKQ